MFLFFLFFSVGETKLFFMVNLLAYLSTYFGFLCVRCLFLVIFFTLYETKFYSWFIYFTFLFVRGLGDEVVCMIYLFLYLCINLGFQCGVSLFDLLFFNGLREKVGYRLI